MKKRTMNNIHIKWLTDEHDCETCGSSYAEGAIVSIDGMIGLDFEPVAHCYAGETYTREQVYRKILEYLGHTIHEKDDR